MWLREKEGGRGRECVDGWVYFNRRTVGPFWKPAGGQREREREWEEGGFIVGWLWGLVGQRKFGGRALESSWPCAQGSTSLDSKARTSGDSKEEKNKSEKKLFFQNEACLLSNILDWHSTLVLNYRFVFNKTEKWRQLQLLEMLDSTGLCSKVSAESTKHDDNEISSQIFVRVVGLPTRKKTFDLQL